MMTKRSSISLEVSAEVGSSMMSTRALVESALAISTICCLETARSPTTMSGSMSMFRRPRIAPASRFISRSESTPDLVRSRPRKMFSATVRCWHMFSSWWMIATPISCAFLGVRSVVISWLKSFIVPLSRV